GRGDLPLFLESRGIRPRRYIGVDALPELVAISRERTASLPLAMEFAEIDAVRSPEKLAALGADVCLASGTLNAMPAEAASDAITAMVKASREAVGFNFLTTRVPEVRQGEDTGPANRFDPLQMLDMAFAHSSLVSFRQDHLNGHDGAVVIILG
ncbi:MAG: class I SAM-dependent methyltransferase, partial [Phycisphaerales bacterium]|nr:class I SAM-dependent methyltransferase [Phycisphaerales bacterium]